MAKAIPGYLGEAKAAQGKWLDGYQVIISEVLRTYGDAKLGGKLPMVSAG